MTTFLSIAWVAKFLIIPIIGWGVASLFFPASRRATPSSTNHVGESGSSPSEKRTERAQIRTPDGDMCYCSRTDDPFEAPRIIRVQARDGMEPDIVFIGSGLRPEFLRASFGNAEPAPAFRLF